MGRFGSTPQQAHAGLCWDAWGAPAKQGQARGHGRCLATGGARAAAVPSPRRRRGRSSCHSPGADAHITITLSAVGIRAAVEKGAAPQGGLRKEEERGGFLSALRSAATDRFLCARTSSGCGSLAAWPPRTCRRRAADSRRQMARGMSEGFKTSQEGCRWQRIRRDCV